MSSFKYNMIKSLLTQKNEDAIMEYAHIEFPNVKSNLVLREYYGEGVRLFKDCKGNTKVLYPHDMTPIQESHLAKAIMTGDVFDDAEEIHNVAKHIEITSLPINGIINKGLEPPTKTNVNISCVVGKMDEDTGSFSPSDADVQNGYNFIKDAMNHDDNNQSIKNIADNYLGNDDHHLYDKDFNYDVETLAAEIDSISDISPEDSITDQDYDEIVLRDYGDDDDDKYETDAEDDDEDESNDDSDDTDDESSEEEEDSDDDESEEDEDSDGESVEDVKEYDEEDTSDEGEEEDISDSEETGETTQESYGYYDEGFLTKKPKKLKPIPIRDIVSYITCEINAIADPNDQAMLSGYTCAKLELVDFYLTCIDTQDERYIVPHTRQYLVDGQRQLNDLLTQILRIRPVNKGDRIWKVNVNYPEGWRG